MARVPSLLLFLVVLLLPLAASAAPPSKWVGAEVPLPPRNDSGNALVPLSAPSKEHPLGTVAIFGQNVRADYGADDASSMLTAYAWDLATQKVFATKPIARLPRSRSVVSAVRDGDRILLVTGGHVHSELEHAEHAEVLLLTLDEALGVVSREVLGVGRTPSLAITDRWIVAGFFERRTTDVPTPGGLRNFEMNLALHAVVLERATHTVVSAHVFQGARLLLADPDALLSTHAFAIRGEHVYVALPGAADATIVQAKLPSLTPVRSRVLDGFQVYAGTSIHTVGDNIVAVTPLGWRVMTPQLDLFPHKFAQVGQAMAWNAKRGVLFAGSTQGKGLPWSTLDIERGCEAMVWAWDQPVALCDGREAFEEEEATPHRLFRRR
jgi:hypothetical protein